MVQKKKDQSPIKIDITNKKRFNPIIEIEILTLEENAQKAINQKKYLKALIFLMKAKRLKKQ